MPNFGSDALQFDEMPLISCPTTTNLTFSPPSKPKMKK